MSRFGRSSMYPVAPPASHWTALDNCSLQLAQSCAHVHNAIEILDDVTRDFPRLATVVDSTRVYDLVPAREIADAQEHLRAEMSPQIQSLIDRAEVALDSLKDKEKQLKSRASHASKLVEKRKQLLNPEVPVRSVAKEEVELAERRLAELRAKKEALGEQVERLEREVESRLAQKTSLSAPSTTATRPAR